MAQFKTLPNGKTLARVRRKGHAEQSQVFSTLALAKAWAGGVEKLLESSRAGVLPTGKNALTVGYLVKRYREQMEPKKPFGRNKADVLRRVETILGSVDVRDLTPDRYVKYIVEERRISGVTAAIDLTYIGGVLKVARALWRLPVHAAVTALEDAREMLRYMGQVHKSEERDRRPTEDELRRLRAWLADHSTSLTPDMLDFIVDSGFRPPSEIERLRWSDLNEEDRTIVIRDRKHPSKKLGNHMIVPLLGRTFEIIQRQPRIEGNDYIFHFNGDSWSSIFPRACAAVDPPIVDLRLYDLRHEAISRLVESGLYSIPEVMLVSGHIDPKMMMRYTQLRAKNLLGREPAKLRRVA